MEQHPAGRLLSVNDTAEYLGITRSSVYRMINAGDLPVVHVGSRTLLDRHDLDAFIERNKAVAG